MSTTETARVLIVNADDFGRSPGINAGVVKAREQGILTSAGLMVRWPTAVEAAAYARRDPALSLGLHVDLGEWHHDNGRWVTVYEVVDTEDRAAVEAEIRAQLDLFRRLTGTDPTHLDSHQHLHRRDGPIRAVMGSLGAELGVPVRELSGDVRYCGEFYGQDDQHRPLPEGIVADNLIRLIRELSPGITEVGCHPAVGDDSDSPYRGEREVEVETLCDPRVRAAIADEGIGLRSFADIS
jgi:chitin disaccharide deacetylase